MDQDILDDGHLHFDADDRKIKATLMNQYDELLDKQQFGKVALWIVLISRIIALISTVMDHNQFPEIMNTFFGSFLIDFLFFGGLYIFGLLLFKKRSDLAIGIGMFVYLFYILILFVSFLDFNSGIIFKALIVGFFVQGFIAARKIQSIKPKLIHYGLFQSS